MFYPPNPCLEWASIYRPQGRAKTGDLPAQGIQAVQTFGKNGSIARSANTGISGYINQRGDVGETLAYNTQGALAGTIYLNDKITFYVKYGDDFIPELLKHFNPLDFKFTILS